MTTGERATRPGRSVATAAALKQSGIVASDAGLLIAAGPIVAAIVVGMAFQVVSLTTLGALAALLAGVVAPPVGLIVLAFLAPLQQPLVLPAPGFDVLLVGAILFGCVARLPIDRPRLTLSPAILLASGFMVYVAVEQVPELLSGYAGARGHLVGYQFLQLVTGFGLVVAAASVLRDRRPGIFIGAAIAGSVLSAIVGIVTFNNPAVGPPIAGLLAVGDTGRAAGPFVNPNYFGLLEASGMAAALAWATRTPSRRLRIALLVVVAILGVGLLVSLSRGAMIALLLGVIGLAFARSRAWGVAAIVIGMALILAIYPAFVEWRLGQTNGLASSSSYLIIAESDASRLDAVLAGPKLFLSSPIFGVGWGHYSFLSGAVSRISTGIAAHNWYINVLAELGAVGIALWTLLLIAVLVALRSRPPTGWMVGVSVFTTVAVGSLFLEPPTSFQASALSSIVIVAALVGDWSRDRLDPLAVRGLADQSSGTVGPSPRSANTSS